MTTIRQNSTQRFSTRVGNYVKYRPTYPRAILETLAVECGLARGAVMADVGSGTGILTRLLLDGGYRVYGVEPNREMREAAERLLADYKDFTSVSGTAEATTLADGSVNCVTVGQAFHWFDPTATRAEFLRILKPGGWVALVWNNRRTDGRPFLEAYEQLLRTYGTDYAAIHEKQVDIEAIRTLFGGGPFQTRSFDNVQHLDLEGLTGRLLSSSYTPEAGNPLRGPMLEQLATIFRAHQVDGQVALEYETRLYFGQLTVRNT
jgi:SAM-dependent methyltransferase